MRELVREALHGERGGRLRGLAAGLFCGFVYLFFGFWDMLIFASIVYAGYSVGRRIDERQPPPGFRLIRDLLARRREF